MSTIEITSIILPSTKSNISPSIPSTSASSAQADLLTSSSPIAAISESESVNPIPQNSLPHPIFPLSHQTLVFNPLLPLHQYRILNVKQKP
ncbi:hypothetical protein TNCV_2570321 [Trichonephila clavipes]|nr:hypothetical protein TNCV_2570321 [Trichonephila clavipes]